ncbi:MAG TPA: type I restriction enzyme HsdR N-terminal domain-containing protein [Saprospiraceae bacterium]|nr:type I restriction enzyme HsdR N-terminal domain-containing protein [Saprospiraceae bacterium]
MTLENFDFSVLDNSEFLEDSVREEIITPILHELGYSATGQNKIVRSKSLTHPFVYIGTIQRKINIIPDYVLYVNNEPAIVLDAKAPNENINSGANVEQAFSYAIHKEIRAWLYGLCNGRKLTIFSISDYESIADIDLVNRVGDMMKIK